MVPSLGKSRVPRRLGIALVGLLGVLVLAGWLAEDPLRHAVIAALQSRARVHGFDLQVNNLVWSPSGLVRLEGLAIRGPTDAGIDLVIAHAQARLDLATLLRGDPHPVDVRGTGARVTLAGCPGDVESWVADLATRVRALGFARHPAPHPVGEAPPRPMARFELALQDARLEVRQLEVFCLEGATPRRLVALDQLVATAEPAPEAAVPRGLTATFEPPLDLAFLGTPTRVGALTLDAAQGLELRNVQSGPHELPDVRFEVTLDRIRITPSPSHDPTERFDVVLDGVAGHARLSDALVSQWRRMRPTDAPPAAPTERLTIKRLHVTGPATARWTPRIVAADALAERVGELLDPSWVAALWTRLPEASRRLDHLRLEVGRLDLLDARGQTLGRADDLRLDATSPTSGHPPTILGACRLSLPDVPGGMTLTLACRPGCRDHSDAADALAGPGVFGAITGIPLDLLVSSGLGQRTIGPQGTLDVAVWGPPPPEDPKRLVHGRVAIRGAALRHPMVSPEPVALDDWVFDWRLDRDLARDTRTLTVEGRAGSGAIGTATLRIREFQRRPVATGILDLPRQPCDRLAQAVPAGLLPTMAGRLALEGVLQGRVEVAEVGLGNPWSLTLAATGDLRDCRIQSLGPMHDTRLDLLARRFRIPIDEGQGPIGLECGPATPEWVPWAQMPPLVQAGPVLTEDGSYYLHEGFSRVNLEKGLRLDLALGRYAYGGSSLTQQLVKNLFVGRTKTLARKLEEALIVVAMERRFDKRSMLEIYLNCIEFGPNVYGIGPAARFYFDKTPATLTPTEVAFLMHLKPAPKGGAHLKKHGLCERWRAAVRKRLEDMVTFGYLPAGSVEAAAPWDPFQSMTADEAPPSGG